MRIPLSKWQMLWLGVMLVSAGCGCNPRIDVYAFGYENVNLLVDLVGVSPSEKTQMDWDSVTNQEYYETGSGAFAAAARYRKRIQFSSSENVSTVTKDNNKAMLFTVGSKDTIWKTWGSLGAVDLYVFAQPGFNSLTALRVPLRCKCWNKGVVEIGIRKGGIVAGGLNDKCLKELRPSRTPRR